MINHKALYAAFDLFPSAKGSATHIYHFSEQLFNDFHGGILFVLGNDKMPEYQLENSIEIFRINSSIENYLQRAELFSYTLKSLIDKSEHLQLCHFRDIWGGLAILQKEKKYKTVFEVNALFSIELPYHYPDMAKSTLKKIEDIEQFCLNESDIIVTPSEIIKQCLIKKEIPADKIRVLSNGADIPTEFAKPEDAPEKYIIYFGALQLWQGVDTLIKAFATLRDYTDLKLVICSSNRHNFSKPYCKLAEKLGVDKNIIWKNQISKEELYAFIQHAILSVAPLKECDRNLTQGCSPIKIFESMACGTAVVASDLPVTREIISNNENGKLIRADRPAELSRAIRFLIDYPDFRNEIAKNAKETIEKKFQWKNIKQKLSDIYSELIKFEKGIPI